ncbi:MAG: hypothetical protein LUG57_02525 [Oscillospiraceae bacterium]|nr:hypothetical protein [Oscillospiraceae bacterium]
MNQSLQALYNEKKRTIGEILSTIRSGDVIFTSNNYSEPAEILSHLHEIAPQVEDVKVWKGRSGPFPFMIDPSMKGHIEMYTYFFGPTFYRNSKPMGLVDFVPADLASYFTVAVSGHPANVNITAVTPMDENGNFHLPMNNAADGLAMLDAVERHKTVILEVNPNLHKMHGAVAINIRDVTMLTEVNRPEFILQSIKPTALERQIGQAVADLVHDGDTIQLGIGGIPNAVGMFLKEKRDLGIHSEMFTTSMMELIQAGAVTGQKKTYDKGLHVCAFAEGTKELYSFLQSREDCIIRAGSEVVDPFNIARQENMVSINTLVEIDLTGQVCAESVGPKQISGSGGSFCFAYGAYRSRGGRSILAFPSRTSKGKSKITASLTSGAVVTVPRNYVDYVVTEYGTARLKGATLSERASQLIAIAHPDDRPALTEQARALQIL